MDEFSLIQQLVNGVSGHAEGLLCGVGDDCAVLTATGAKDWLITTDALVDEVHFRRDWAEWSLIGRKAVAVNVSDIAAMGGRPRFLLVTLAIPPDVSAAAVTELYRGIRSEAEQWQMPVVGGDTVASPSKFMCSITAVGEVPHGRAAYRRGARIGDGVYVTGAFGGSGVGLEALRRQQTTSTYHPFVQHHLHPTPRVAAGQWLTSTGCVTSMIDISDGLLADLGHIAAAGNVGIMVEAIRVPLVLNLPMVLEPWGIEPVGFALGSGEEYELAFTIAGAREEAFQRFLRAAEKTLGHQLTRIGVVTTGRGVQVVDALGHPFPVPQRGFVHQFAD